MSEPKKPAGKPISDVAHPGESAPSASSRPVIVTNRPILKDPMVVDKDTESATLAEVSLPKEEKTEEKPSSASSTKPKIQPLTTAIEPPADEPEPEKDAPTGTQPVEKAAVKDEKPVKEDTESGSQDNPTEAAPDPITEIEAEAKKQAEHNAVIQKLADAKQYFLPINSIEKRRSKRFVALGIVLSLLLALAWADIALDAGLIHLQGVKPVTHFFSN